VLTLALNSVVTNLLVVFFLVVCVAMILIVLIQRPQGGGLSGAFGAGGGGAGAGQTAFGTKTGDVLTWGTVSVFFIYLVVAVGLNFVARPDTSGAVEQPVLVTPESQTEPPAAEEPETLPPLEGADPDTEGQTPPEGDAAPTPAGDDDQSEDGTPEVDPASAETPAETPA
tara:strand:- start:7906 stop:8415 length:510 start_codon:yes stop_codon:yes gene_type:complete